MDYKDTVQLPKTKFPMRANLPQREPILLKKWQEMDLYLQLRKASNNKKKFILHDGPPYANGHLHMGHAINKVLKDVIVKSQQMRGFDANYVPGWDCHGLPIETKVEQELNKKKRRKEDIPITTFRRLCREYATKWVAIQKEEFVRLGIIGQWDNPYLTMANQFEADIVRELGKFLANGGLFKGLKPVYWCVNDVTALAEAEVDYQDHQSHSIHLKFPLSLDESLIELDSSLQDSSLISVVIWTTTPWTIPANLAISLNPEFTYVALRVNDAKNSLNLNNGEILILAEGLWKSAIEQMGLDVDQTKIVARFKGHLLENKCFRHPYLDQDAPILLGNHVTLEAGTGCVHTAPGHGHDDFVVGQKYGLKPFNPVNGHGIFQPETPHFGGQHIFKANTLIVDFLREKGQLLATSTLNHSYPHCWRCHKPVVIRATPQWFISMETNDLRKKALTAIKETQWIPTWGEERIHNMVAVRPDWCVSRQRTWGVPITVIHCTQCQTALTDSNTLENIALQVEQHSADIWFGKEAKDFLVDGFCCPNCGSDQFEKEKDILDVWFDSGVTHAAVLENDKANGWDLQWPADLYLEGSDQHRGWFHSSLLAAVGTRNRAPYKAVLTHGFVVDGQGRKMSKSLGNVIAPEKIIKQYGADILRMWVTSEDYSGDIRISDEILKGLSDAYRRIRNTMRFLLSNLGDYSHTEHAVPLQEMPLLDQWALDRLATLVQRVENSFDTYTFHRVYQDLHYFCGVDMGSFYLDIIKDRLYCEGKNSSQRRSAQTVLHHMLETLVRLTAPILSFTAEEIWSYMPGERSESVHLAEFPKPNLEWINANLDVECSQFRMVRAEVYRLLEQERREKRIGSFMEMDVTLYLPEDLHQLLETFQPLFRLLIVARVTLMDLEKAPPELAPIELGSLSKKIKIDFKKTQGDKCQRCWNWDDNLGHNDQHPELCPRCQTVLTNQVTP